MSRRTMSTIYAERSDGVRRRRAIRRCRKRETRSSWLSENEGGSPKGGPPTFFLAIPPVACD